MRRISIGLMLLVLVPSIAQADYVVPLRCRVQFSPYAFGYHNNGLVPGGIVYSPYAFSPRNSGLVFEGVRYTPYAFTYHSTGLVLDYYWYPIPYAVYSPSCSPDQVYPMYNGVPPCSTTSGRPSDVINRSRSYHQSHDAVVPAPAPARARGPVVSADREDAITVIRRHLRERGLTDIGINRILRIDNKLVSADFTLGGRNVLIKYWDPTQIESPDTKAAPQRKVVEKYKKDWESFAGKYQQDGGEVYVVAASGRADIVAALDACKSLTPDGAKSSPQVMYAKQ